LALGSALFVKIKGIGAFGTTYKAQNIETKKQSVTEVLAASPNSNYVKKLSPRAFSRVYLSTFAGNLEICRDTETYVELIDADTNNLAVEIVGDTFTVKEIDPASFMGIFLDENGFSFKGLRHSFAKKNSFNAEKRIVLHLAEDLFPEQIHVVSQYGDVSLWGISANEITVESKFGSVFFGDIKNQSAKLNVKGSFCDVTVQNCVYQSCALNTKIGSVYCLIPSELCQSTVCENWIGNMKILTDVPTSSFKLNCSTSFGTVKKNGEEIGKKCSEASKNANRITAKTLFGTIDLSFTGGNEEDYVAVDAELPLTQETVTETKEEISTAN
jgi:hypothetical protein